MKVKINTWDSLSKKQRLEIEEYIKTRGVEVYQEEAK